jgi:uncharacterized protein involved in exopolysaccharide biosynthesis
MLSLDVETTTPRPNSSEMTPPVASNSGDVTIAELIEKTQELGRTVWRKRRLFFAPLAITISLGLVIALASHDEYTASTKLLPYRTGPSSTGLAGLAGLAGITIPSGSGDQTITADLYPVIAQTLDFRISVAETPLRFSRSSQPTTMIKYFEDHRSVVDALSSYLADMRPSSVSASPGERSSPNLTVTGGNGDTLRVFGREYLKIVQNLDSRLIVNIDRKTSVISITGVMPAPYAAADLVQTASERLMQRIIDYEAKKAGEQLKFIEQQYDQARTRYQQAQENLAVFADRNRSLVSPLSQVERDRLQSEFNVASDVYQQLSGQLQMARIKKNQDTPVFTVLERVTVPLRRSSPHPTRILLLAIFLGLLIGSLRILYESQRPVVAIAPLLEERTRVLA